MGGQLETDEFSARPFSHFMPGKKRKREGSAINYLFYEMFFVLQDFSFQFFAGGNCMFWNNFEPQFHYDECILGGNFRLLVKDGKSS